MSSKESFKIGEIVTVTKSPSLKEEKVMILSLDCKKAAVMHDYYGPFIIGTKYISKII